MPGGSPCGLDGSYAASWVSGVTRVPSAPDLLITFNNYCVLGGTGGFVREGFGLAEYDPATGALSDDVTVFAGCAPLRKLLIVASISSSVTRPCRSSVATSALTRFEIAALAS